MGCVVGIVVVTRNVLKCVCYTITIIWVQCAAPSAIALKMKSDIILGDLLW